jgi:hypothetical protein
MGDITATENSANTAAIKATTGPRESVFKVKPPENFVEFYITVASVAMGFGQLADMA